MPPPTRPAEERFWEKVNKTETCWLWLASVNNKGYGEIHYGERNEVIYAHRLSWILHNGPIPSRLCVLHRCDTPRCVRPDHLFLGTQADNMHDAKMKGRARGGGLYGEKHGMCRLTVKAVRQIRKSKLPGVLLATMFGITPSHVSSIRRNKVWKHLA